MRWCGLALMLVTLVGADEMTDRIEALREQIAYHDDLYFRQASPELTDYEYDLLKAELRRLEREAGLTSDGIGDDRSGIANAITHRQAMLSLDKAYAPDEVADWLARVHESGEGRPVVLAIEPKYDGVAVSVTLYRGELQQAATRGNGAEGEDITQQVDAIRGLYYEWALDEGVPGASGPIETIELRGEIYLDHDAFARLNERRAAAGEEPFRQPRSVAAGTIKLADLAEVTQRGLSIVFHGWGEVQPAEAAPTSVQAFQVWLAERGLPGVHDGLRVAPADGAALEAAIAAVRQASVGYPTDGVVIKVDDVVLQQRLGNGPTAPRWALARKFAPPRAATTLRTITWQMGRTGVLTPVAEFDPVELAGSRIRRATLHNPAEIARRDLRVGDTVWIEKAGEIIPVVAGVDLDLRPAAAEPVALPIRCPFCDAELVEDTGLNCPNFDCGAQVEQRLLHFASRGALGISGLGPALVSKLVAAGLVRSPADLYALTATQLIALPGVGEATAQRLLDNIAASRSTERWRVIVGLGLPGVGPRTAQTWADAVTRLSDLLETNDVIGTEGADVLRREDVRELVQALDRLGLGRNAE